MQKRLFFSNGKKITMKFPSGLLLNTIFVDGKGKVKSLTMFDLKGWALGRVKDTPRELLIQRGGNLWVLFVRYL
jgi:hypothetical protein